MTYIPDPFESLCLHDPRSSSFALLHDDDDDDDDRRLPRVNCYCDECFYRRDPLALEVIRLRSLLDNHNIQWALNQPENQQAE
jgi:hypothetical protein